MINHAELRKQLNSLIDEITRVNTAVLRDCELVSSDLLQFIDDHPGANALQTVEYPAENYIAACKTVVSTHVDLVVRLNEFIDKLSADASDMTAAEVYDAIHWSPSTSFAYICDDVNVNEYYDFVNAVEFAVQRHEFDYEITECLGAYKRWLMRRAYGSPNRRDALESLDHRLGELIQSITA